MAKSSGVGRIGERRTHRLWVTRRERPPRSKLGSPLISWLGAAHGQYLNFFDDDGKFTVEVSDEPDQDADWSLLVTEDMRPRLTLVHIWQLGAEVLDTLVFTLQGEGIASVEVLKGELAEVAPPEPFFLPDELEEGQTYIEGAAKRVTLNAYERDQRARLACIAHYGLNCAVCGFNFEKYYGQIGRDYINVHHLKPLSEIGEKYKVDPFNDLRPVCPNCHAMLHRRKYPPYSIEELRDIIETRRRAGGAGSRTAGRRQPPPKR